MEIENISSSQTNFEDSLIASRLELGLFENVRICRDEDFQPLVSKAAETAGCEFLFEIPALMIGENGKKAAALRFSSEMDEQICFIVVNKQSGSIDILEEDDVDEAVLDFVASYSNVLGHLFDTQNHQVH